MAFSKRPPRQDDEDELGGGLGAGPNLGGIGQGAQPQTLPQQPPTKMTDDLGIEDQALNITQGGGLSLNESNAPAPPKDDNFDLRGFDGSSDAEDKSNPDPNDPTVTTVPEGAPPPPDVDALAEAFIAANLTPGQDDTAAERANIDQQIDRRLGQDIVKARARGGRAGFGSGAMQAMELQASTDAALDADEQMFGVREREQNQEHDFGMDAINADAVSSENARRDAAQAAAFDAEEAIADAANATGPGGVPTVGERDQNGDGKVSSAESAAFNEAGRENRGDFTANSETVDLGLGGDDTPGSPDTPYLMTSGKMRDMKKGGYTFQLDPDYNNGIDRRFIDQDGNYWFVRGQT